MEFNKKILCILILSIMFLTFLVFEFLYKNYDEHKIVKVISPIEFIVDNDDTIRLSNINTFDADYTESNKKLANALNINEDEAFILGNLGKYWANHLLKERRIRIGDNDFIYHKFNYSIRLKNSSFGICDNKPTNKYAFERQLKSIKKGKFVILDLDTDISYPVSKINRERVKNFVVVRKNHVKNVLPETPKKAAENGSFSHVFDSGDVRIVVSDLTAKLLPDRNCSSEICKEILKNINSSKTTIDMAIYGYSSTPKIEQALERAKQRGVKIRLIYDIDSKGENIYPDTSKLVKLIPESVSDKNSYEVKNTMHNKFYIFDNKTVITGSANLSHTDMSGYNSNSIIVINSPQIVKYYTDEFNQMFSEKFHNDKISTGNKISGNIQVFFSPQDKAITNGILSLIRQAKKYIYVPSFVITEKRVTTELINAKQRGVDVRIIADALNASTKHSKSKELRSAGVLVKAENYAGKMHSKTMIIDDEYLIIGSMNFSDSGENRNDENMIILKDSSAVKFYRKFFLYQWDKIPDKWLKYTPRAEGVNSIGSCYDGLDNNYDGKTDLEDEACRG